MKPGCTNTTDIHAGPLPNRLQALEDSNVFGGVVGGWHVYNVRLVTSARSFLVCTTIFVVCQLPVSAATVVYQDVPVPGGTAALARALVIEPVPDRARFMTEVTRLVYDSDGRNPTVVAFLNSLRLLIQKGKKLTLPFDDGSSELVPVPLSPAVWSNAIFRRTVTPEELIPSILADRPASLICHGLVALDDETLQFFAEHSGLLTRLYERSAPMFSVFSSGLRIRANRIVPAGDAAAVPLWEAVVGEKVARPERFVLALFEVSDGRLAYLYNIAGQIDPARRAFLLGSWMADPNARL